MKHTLTLILATFVAGTSFAQMGHSVSKNAKHVITCPVTGDKLDRDAATKHHMFADYKGNRYFFCCKDCPAMFNAHPEKYKNKAHVKSPVTNPKAN